MGGKQRCRKRKKRMRRKREEGRLVMGGSERFEGLGEKSKGIKMERRGSIERGISGGCLDIDRTEIYEVLEGDPRVNRGKEERHRKREERCFGSVRSARCQSFRRGKKRYIKTKEIETQGT